jgi:hypothetical protein
MQCLACQLPVRKYRQRERKKEWRDWPDWQAWCAWPTSSQLTYLPALQLWTRHPVSWVTPDITLFSTVLPVKTLHSWPIATLMFSTTLRHSYLVASGSHRNCFFSELHCNKKVGKLPRKRSMRYRHICNTTSNLEGNGAIRGLQASSGLGKPDPTFTTSIEIKTLTNAI